MHQDNQYPNPSDQWWGYHSTVGWVVLDREVARNSVGGKSRSLVFARCSNWSLFSLAQKMWDPPLCTYALTYINGLPLSERQSAKDTWGEYRRQFIEKRDLLREQAENFEAYQKARELARREQARALKQSSLDELRSCFENDFSRAQEFYLNGHTQHLNINEFHAAKVDFVQTWARKHLNSQPPDVEQAAAIGAIENHVQVVARAGSGKTTTLVAKAVFLQKHCGVSPDQMLLLAFNSDAASKMRRELERHLSDKSPNAMTFHALAYGLVNPEKSVLADEREGDQKRSRVMQNIIDAYISDPRHYNEVRSLMMKYFREDWEAIIKGGMELTPKELTRYRYSLPRVGLDGKHYKSRGEKVIADFLFEHDIPYRYELNHWWDSMNYRPDFTLEDHKTVIEFFGLEGDPDYDKKSDAKRAHWHNNKEWSFVELSPNDLWDTHKFKHSFTKSLEKHGITCVPLSEEEIWQRVNAEKRAIDRFTRVVIGFVGRCCKSSLSPEDLNEKISGYKSSGEVESLFLPLVRKFYKTYLERLKLAGENDFDLLIQKATEKILSGETIYRRPSGSGDLMNLRYVLIDEYQDFSDLFHRLIEAVRSQAPNVRFFCVGDDWQAINGFAGSDLRFYRNFSQYFVPAERFYVTTNYRSPISVVEAGNALMHNRGKSAKAHKDVLGSVLVANLGFFSPTAAEEHMHSGDVLTPAILRIASRTFKATSGCNRTAEDAGVVLLNRTNYIHWYVNYRKSSQGSSSRNLSGYIKHLNSFLPLRMEGWVSGSTAHKYKGEQKDTVILLDAVPRSYPLLHPDAVFTRIFDTSVNHIIDEERRLFYVALTRAIKKLIIFTDSDQSPFLEDLLSIYKCSWIDWNDYPPIANTTNYLTVKITNRQGRKGTFGIKDLLKAERYEWKGSPLCVWQKTFPGFESSTREILDRFSWVPEADGVVVQFVDGQGTVVDSYVIDSGRVSKFSNR